MVSPRRGISALALVLVATGCGGPGARDIVEPGQVPGSSAAPKIDQVTDLGDLPALPARGALPAPDSDGHFVLGEMVLIEGHAFGKSPEVRIGGRQTRILARTGSGGILCRVPVGIDGGPAQVVVSTLSGHDATTIEATRMGLLVDRAAGLVHVLALGRSPAGQPTVRRQSTLHVAGALAAAFSPDGRAAYVVANPTASDDTPSLQVLAMTSGGGPRSLFSRHLDLLRVSAVAVAHDAPVMAVAGGGKLVLVDLSNPRAPRLGQAFPLVGEVRALALSPDGHHLVALSPQDNLLTPIALDRPGGTEPPAVGRPVDLAPGQPEPLAVDVAVAPGGTEAWAAVGDGPGSVGGGHHPTHLEVVDLGVMGGADDAAGGSARVVRTVDVATAGAPVGLAVGPRDAVGAAATSLDQNTPVVLAAVDPAFYARSGRRPSRLDDLGRLVLARLDGHVRVLVRQTALFGRPQVTNDLDWALSPTVRLVPGPGGTTYQVGVTIARLSGAAERGPAGSARPGASFSRLAAASAAELHHPPSLALCP